MASNMSIPSASSGGVYCSKGLSFSLGKSRPTSCQRSTSMMASVLWTCTPERFRFFANSLIISVGMVPSAAILTGNPTSLSSRDSSTAVMKSQASSMVTLTSALRVTLKV